MIQVVILIKNMFTLLGDFMQSSVDGLTGNRYPFIPLPYRNSVLRNLMQLNKTMQLDLRNKQKIYVYTIR